MSFEMLMSMARARFSTEAAPTPPQLREMLSKLQIALPEPLTADQVESAAKILESEFLVDLGPAHSVSSPEFHPWLAAKKHAIEFHYWRRYRDHLVAGGFGQRVVDRVDEVTDRILDLTADPTRAGEWRRRGLVVGHVQSGKTANYIGLINKAADAGYRLIVLIAGVHNNLRSQTQERVDEGFVGRDSEQLLSGQANPAYIGVGKRNRSLSAVSFTSRAHDFSSARASGLGVPINNLAQPAIFVIKKNKRILENLINWLRTTTVQSGKLHVPMLVIDDEADNASVNTGTDPGRPNAINGLIRNLLSLSTKNSYIGYTATPFANIFIDPDSESEAFGDDLFPEHFIVGLDAPSNYVGAREFFLEEDRELTCDLDEDTDDWLPVTHKIDAVVDELHPSLEDAIGCFVISKAIRIHRDQGDRHHSMLVNVSRFTGIQGKVAREISGRLHHIQRAVENRHALPVDQALKDPFIRDLHATWVRHYADRTAEPWEEIQPLLHRAVAGMRVVEVNATSGPGVLDYRAHANGGLNVIAVGGNSLSRGFTLEGLTVSYFLRNTQMYDTLLQMGRWFGYRDGYGDLCRLFLKEEAHDWYAYIADAAEELRAEIRRMETLGLTPKDFGLAVRSHPGSLLVTARNKMRSAEEIVREIGLANRTVESAVIHAAPTIAEHNLKVLKDFVRQLLASGKQPKPFGKGERARGHVFSDVPAEMAISFMQQFELHPGNIEMAKAPLLDYARRRTFDGWDVVVASRSDALAAEREDIDGLAIGPQRRSIRVTASAPRGLLVSGEKRRVASRGLEAAGLSTDQIEAAQGNWDKSGKNMPDRLFREQRTRPLLMLHILEINEPPENTPSRHAAYGVSFPCLRPGEKEERVTYTANVQAYREVFGSAEEDEDEALDL